MPSCSFLIHTLSLCVVTIKWNKQSFDNFEVDPALGVEVLKAQLFDLTNVPCDKQKIMFKGKILKVCIVVLILVNAQTTISTETRSGVCVLHE